MCNHFAGMRLQAAAYLINIPPILIIYVVSVLPHIHGEKGGLPVHQGDSALGVLVTFSLPSLPFTSQAHPLPN